MDIIKQVDEILERNGFNYFSYSGCFDIIAKKRYIILLKVLSNVDSFQEGQANNLKIISNNLKAVACLIGTHTRTEKLKDNVVYERFGIPTFAPNTLENILTNEIPLIRRDRGGYFVKVDANKLREARNKKQMTQAELAKIAGVTKKNIYEHEAKDMEMQYGVALKVEKVLGDITIPTNLNTEFNIVENKAFGRFEKIVSNDLSHLGFSTSFVYKTPFNIIAREKEFLLLSEADEKENHIRRNIPYMEGFSKIARKPVLIITKNESSFDLPTIEEKELKEITQKELKKILKRK
jgi:putative transcriptional regulator